MKQTIHCFALALAGAGLLAAQGTQAPGTQAQGTPAQGSQDDQKLLRTFENPLAALFNVGFPNLINFPVGPFSRNQYTMIIQPLLPLRVSNYWELITVPFTPVFFLPDVRRPAGGTWGLGDMNPHFLFTPVRPGKLIWAIGPTLLLPTATERVPPPVGLGQGKVGLGPKIALLTQSPKWTIGFLANNIWSVAGDGSRPPVNQFTLQYFIDYNLRKGWFLTSSPAIRSFWRLPPHDRWQVPFGGGFGKIYRIGPQAMVSSVDIYNIAIRPRDFPFPRWQVRLTVNLLFPRTPR